MSEERVYEVRVCPGCESVYSAWLDLADCLQCGLGLNIAAVEHLRAHGPTLADLSREARQQHELDETASP